MNHLMLIIIAAVAILLAVIIMLIIHLSRMNHQLSTQLANTMDKQLETMRGELNARLNETSRAIAETHKTVGERLDNATKIFGTVATSLGQLQEANKRLLEVGQDIASLQELLRAPKFRGEIGETMLENILAQVLPKDHFELQYHFKTGDAVDAVIKLADHLVCIDSKFSYENFKKMIEADHEDEKASYQKKFIKDVKNRIDEISAKYILPDERTFDFALMYITAENVYYETIIKGDFLSYSLSKKVVPVSPNTFYAYLQVICLGLRGMKIESNVQKIIASLNQLQGDLKKFDESFKVVGSHIRNAATKYTEAEKKLERFSDKLISVEQSKQIEAL
ncbi:MAG: DNA recombination protein RmuC [Candidatus Omnitrophota bacterium]